MVYLRIFHNPYHIAGSGGTGVMKGRIDLMDLKKKYCPYCGEKLDLIPPQKDNNPVRMGLSANGVEFCVKPEFRIRSYAHRNGESRKSDIESQKRYFESNSIDQYQGTLHARGNARFRCITTRYIDSQIKKGGQSLYKEYLTFSCRNCHNLLALNCNPWRSAAIFEWLLPLVLCVGVVAFLLSITGMISFSFLAIFLAAILGIISVYFLVTISATRHIEKVRSNFAPIDEYDCLKKLPGMIWVNGIKHKYRHKTNMFEAEVDGVRFHLYLTDTDEDTDIMYISENKDKQKLVLSTLSRVNTGKNDPVFLSLFFEGKNAGNVEIVRICDRTEDDYVPN